MTELEALQAAARAVIVEQFATPDDVGPGWEDRVVERAVEYEWGGWAPLARLVKR